VGLHLFGLYNTLNKGQYHFGKLNKGVANKGRFVEHAVADACNKKSILKQIVNVQLCKLMVLNVLALHLVAEVTLKQNHLK
jgi:hypothetical protein